MPVLARVYHVAPHDQQVLTIAEFRALQADYRQVLEQQQQEV